MAVETGTLEATAADVEKVAKLFSDPEAAEFFTNPIIEIDEKREVQTSLLQPHPLTIMCGSTHTRFVACVVPRDCECEIGCVSRCGYRIFGSINVIVEIFCLLSRKVV